MESGRTSRPGRSVPTEQTDGPVVDWYPMESAPEDGTWIIGRNKNGREARITSRVTHPMIPMVRHWGEGEAVNEGNWVRSVCFYPVEWRPES